MVRIGRSCCTPEIRRPTSSGTSYPPVSTIEDSAGKVPDCCAITSPGSRSYRSPGAITVQFSVRRLSTLGRLIAAITVPTATRSSHSGLPCSSVPPTASFSSCTVGARITGFSGIAATSGPGTRAETTSRMASSESGSARLTTTAIGSAWWPPNSPTETAASAAS